MSTEKPENDQTPAEEPTKEAPAAAEEAKTQASAKPEEAPAKKVEAPAKKVEEPASKAEEAPAAKAEAPAAKAEASQEAPAQEPEADSKEGGQKEGEKKDSAVEELLKDEFAGVKIRRAKGSKNITHGVVHVIATFNNTKVSVSDMKGNVISWSSAGKCNFRGSRKSTAYAAQVVTQDATRAAMAHGLKEVEVHLKGPGLGRDSAVRALQALGLIIVSIIDKTPVPHNGCRPPKRRRV
jgi:small subunit ribosomal protein S11